MIDPTEVLALRRELRKLMKTPEQFIAKILDSDPVWVERCQSILVRSDP